MLHNVYLIKGWLLDKNPPKEVNEALEAVIELLIERPPRVPNPPILHAGRAEEVVAAFLDDRPLEAESEVAIAPPPASCEDPPPKPRRKHNMSPEARAAARQRMIDMQARKRAARETVAEPQSRDDAPAYSEADLRITVPVKRRKSRLTDGEWLEIKNMLAAGRDRKAIAGDFDEDPEDLDFFIASCQRREGKEPGEAGASPSGVTSGATRTTW